MNIIIDLIRKKNEHHVFNFETIKSLNKLDKECVYFLDRKSSSIDAITDKKNLHKVNVKSSKLYFWLNSTLELLKIIIKYKGKSNKFILLSATPLQYQVCSYLTSLFKIDINIFMHGELGYISNPQGLGQRLGGYFLNSSFNNIKSRVNFIALSEYICSRLSSKYNYTGFHFVEHPLQQVKSVDLNNGETIKIGSFGVHSYEKSSNEIYNLAKLVDIKGVKNIELVTVGVSSGNFEYDLSPNVSHICRGFLNSSLIPKNEFLAQVQALDFALFFSGDDEKYDLIPSGVFADCIAFELPIISLYNSKMEHFFKKHGAVGILCKSVDEMADALLRLSCNSNELHDYKKVIRNVKANFTSDAYSKQLYRVLYEKC